MKNSKQVAGEKRWEKVGKEERSEQMKKTRGIVDFSKIKLPYRPQDLKVEILEEMSNRTQKGIEAAILLSLSDKKHRTQKEIQLLVDRITLTAACEINRRMGLIEVSDDFNWFTNWNVKMKAMICPSCSHRWKMDKKDKSFSCPSCGLDIIKFAEEMMPGLKKLKGKK